MCNVCLHVFHLHLHLLLNTSSSTYFVLFFFIYIYIYFFTSFCSTYFVFFLFSHTFSSSFYSTYFFILFFILHTSSSYFSSYIYIYFFIFFLFFYIPFHLLLHTSYFLLFLLLLCLIFLLLLLIQLLMVPTPFFIGVHKSFLEKMAEPRHPEAWVVNLDRNHFEPPSCPDQQTITDFPYSILQLQADIRKVVCYTYVLCRHLNKTDPLQGLFQGGQRGLLPPPPPYEVLCPPFELILAMHTETKAIVGCIIYHWVV